MIGCNLATESAGTHARTQHLQSRFCWGSTITCSPQQHQKSHHEGIVQLETDQRRQTQRKDVVLAKMRESDQALSTVSRACNQFSLEAAQKSFIDDLMTQTGAYTAHGESQPLRPPCLNCPSGSRWGSWQTSFSGLSLHYAGPKFAPLRNSRGRVRSGGPPVHAPLSARVCHVSKVIMQRAAVLHYMQAALVAALAVALCAAAAITPVVGRSDKMPVPPCMCWLFPPTASCRSSTRQNA